MDRAERPSSRKVPSTLCHHPGCVRGWSCRVRLGDANPERPRSSFAPPPAKEVTFPKTRVLEPPRRSEPVKGHPFEPVDRPPLDASPRGAWPMWRASAGFASSSRLTLNAWSGDWGGSVGPAKQVLPVPLSPAAAPGTVTTIRSPRSDVPRTS